MKLLVISHTPHYKREDGVIVGWGATVREINYLTEVFSEIYHIAPLYASTPPASSSAYLSSIFFIAINPTGGEELKDKFSIVTHSRSTIKLIGKYLQKVDCFQFRAPTGIGVYLIPWLSLWSGKRGWFKYAGNWVARDLPLSYRFQRYLLKHVFKTRPVTINGFWNGQPKHVLSFENPALTDQEIQEGSKASETKDFDQKLTLLFVGRVEPAKGFDLLLEMLLYCNPAIYKELIVVGDGKVATSNIDQNSTIIPIRMLGGIPRNEINKFYETSHILILPSLSEGFPKVVAEAAAYGCVPALFNVSAIDQYIDKSNGLLFSSTDPATMAQELSNLCENRFDLKMKSITVTQIAEKFTYSYYNKRIRENFIHE